MGPQSSTWQFCDRALFGMVKWPKLRLSDLMEIIPLLGGHHHFHWFSGHVFKLRTTSRCPSPKFEKISKNLLMKLEKIIFPNQNFLPKNWEKKFPHPPASRMMIPRFWRARFFGREVPLCSSVSSFDISASASLDTNDLDQGSKHSSLLPKIHVARLGCLMKSRSSFLCRVFLKCYDFLFGSNAIFVCLVQKEFPPNSRRLEKGKWKMSVFFKTFPAVFSNVFSI